MLHKQEWRVALNEKHDCELLLTNSPHMHICTDYFRLFIADDCGLCGSYTCWNIHLICPVTWRTKGSHQWNLFTKVIGIHINSNTQITRQRQAGLLKWCQFASYTRKIYRVQLERQWKRKGMMGVQINLRIKISYKWAQLLLFCIFVFVFSHLWIKLVIFWYEAEWTGILFTILSTRCGAKLLQAE